MSKPLYRTVIRGKLIQESPLAALATAPDSRETDTFQRDGLGRLTLYGSALAGGLIETAARIVPDLLGEPLPGTGSAQPTGSRIPEQSYRSITAKRRGRHRKAPKASQSTSEPFDQSVWIFENAHIHGDPPTTEWRQGVGIRQATGAAARDKGPLYDFEVVPTGTAWTFQLEIDTHRGSELAEHLAVLALDEWCRGRAWLGGRAVRGYGWCRLEIDMAVRLVADLPTLQAWPDNTADPAEALEAARCLPDSQTLEWNDLVTNARNEVGLPPAEQAWHYLCLEIEADITSPSDTRYGFDPLRIAGHPLGLDPLPDEDRWQPHSGKPEPRELDRPFLRTASKGKDGFQPALPGSGIRGPLRHAASRLLRMAGTAVRDPNDSTDPEASKLIQAIRKLREEGTQDLSSVDVRLRADLLTQWLGAEELSSWVLIREAQFHGSPRYARLQLHAEDEFTAGVYGNAKFDAELLVQGTFRFPIVIELPPYRPPSRPLQGKKKPKQEDPSIDLRRRLAELDQWLVPALQLAQFGHVPLGGGKWSGSGWLPWRIRAIAAERAGHPDTSPPLALSQWLESFKARLHSPSPMQDTQ